MAFSLKLRKKILHAPNGPGVYFFKNARGEIIYIGKAANLKRRLSSYVTFAKNASKTSEKGIIKKHMIAEIKEIEWHQTLSPIEALIEEAKLIKRFKPLYNVLFRDDKDYFYVVFTDEPFPRVYITHQPKFLAVKLKKELADVIGPFTEGRLLKEALRYLRKIFPYCTCSSSHKKICPSAQLHLCPGYCCVEAKETSSLKTRQEQIKQYQAYQISLKKALRGDVASLISSLEKLRQKKIKEGALQQAALCQRQISALQSIFAHKKLISSQYLKEEKISFPVSVKAFLEELKISALPQSLEAYDVSHLGGTMATGSRIVFSCIKKSPSKNKKFITFAPDKNNYRHFRIKTSEGFNDLIMLKEILQRRMHHLTEWGKPQFILIDGGITQLKTALSVLQKFSLSPSLFSLAKGRKWLYTVSYPLSLDNPQISYLPLNSLSPDISRLIEGLISEAHRFALNYHSLLRKKQIKKGKNL